MANNPSLLLAPIAVNGERNAIPLTTGATTGLLCQDLGWQSINSLPRSAGGKAPTRLDFNGVFYLMSSIIFYAQKGWTFKFETTQDYYAGCKVVDPTDNKTYECISDVSASNTYPHSDTTHWRVYLSNLAYLPISGGALTGTTIKRNVDNSELALLGGSDINKGAGLFLRGKDKTSNTGEFCLRASNGSLTKDLVGTPSGGLKWNGYDVITTQNGNFLPLAGGNLTGQNIGRNVNNSLITVRGGNDSAKGGQINLYGKDHATQGGNFEVQAIDGNGHTSTLQGTPTGDLKWNGQDVVTKNVETRVFPDYSSGVTIPANTKYVTTFDCFVVVKATNSISAESSVASLTVYDSSNNIIANWSNRNFGDSTYNYSSVTGYFKAGTIIECGVTGSPTCKAYPLIL